MKMMEEKLIMTEEYKEKEINDMKKEMTKAHEEFEDTLKRLRHDNDKLTDEKNDLKYELDNLAKRFEEYKQSKNVELQSINSVYEAKLRELDINYNADIKLTSTTNHNTNTDNEITKIMERHYEENKSLQNAIKELIQTHNQEKQNTLKQKECEIEQSNETINKLTERNSKLEKRLKEAKIYYRLFKHSQSHQCKYCNKFYPSSIFMTHTQTCSIGGAIQTERVNFANMEISITQTLIREDENLRKPFTIYVIKVELDGDHWVVQRKYKEFCILNENLINHYPNVKFPSTISQFASKSLKDIVKKKKTAVVEDRRKTLQRYLNGL